MKTMKNYYIMLYCYTKYTIIKAIKMIVINSKIGRKEKKTMVFLFV